MLKLFAKNQSKIVDGAVKVVDNVFGLIDKKKFTEQEASRFNLETAEAAAQFVKETLNESTERSITRRQIAVIYIAFFCALVLFVIIAWKFDRDWGVFILNVIRELQLGWAFMAVIAFFFGAQILRQYTGQKKKPR